MTPQDTPTPRIDAILRESGSWKDGIMTGLEVELADEGKKMERSLAAAQARTFGCALAMRVLQSDLYRQLDDTERAECDELIARWNAALAGSAQEEGRCPRLSHMIDNAFVRKSDYDLLRAKAQALQEQLNELQQFHAEVMAGCDIQKPHGLYRQCKVVIGPGQTENEIALAAAQGGGRDV
jgi:polyhydroxyalkanoate synthesis regulator phasin